MDASIVVAFITGVLGPIAILAAKYFLDKKKAKPDMVKEALETSEKVMHKLDLIRDEFETDRVWVAQFHNGGNYYPTGKSMAKFSFIYESVSADTFSIQTSFQNIPVSIFSKPINHLLEKNIVEIYDFKDPETATYGLKYIAEQNESKSIYLFAIKNIENKFIGVLGIDYTKRKTKLNQDEIHTLTMHASSISGVLI